MQYIIQKDNIQSEYKASERLNVIKIDFPKKVEVVTVFHNNKLREEDILNESLWGNYDFN